MPDGPDTFHLLAILLGPLETAPIETALRAFKKAFPRPLRITVLSTGVEETWPGSLAWAEGVLTHAHFSFPALTGEGRKKSALALVTTLRDLLCDGAVIFAPPEKSPYGIAYLCYLAGIRVRIGQSAEFGGGVLSRWVRTLPEKEPVDRHLSLLRLIDPPGAGATTSIK